MKYSNMTNLRDNAREIIESTINVFQTKIDNKLKNKSYIVIICKI
jgi:abortive infection bacteriophage resistance protein